MRARNVCETIADIADAAFPRDFRLDFLLSKHARHLLRNVEDRIIAAAADVKGPAHRRVALQCQPAGFGDIAGVDKIAALLPVLENQRRPFIEQAGSEDRQNAAVRIGERLVGSIDVEEAQCHGRDLVGAADHQA